LERGEDQQDGSDREAQRRLRGVIGVQCNGCGRPVREDLAACPVCGADLLCRVAAADGKQYGPYPLADVRRYVAEGRIAPNAQVSQGGGPWQPVGVALGQAPAVVRPSASRAKRGMSPVATVLIILGVIAALGAIAVVVLLGRVQSTAMTETQSASCRSNLKQIALGMMMFAMDHNETFPNSTTWQTDIQPYLKSPDLYACPGSGKGSGSYEMNPSLSQVAMGQITNPMSMPLVYDAGFPNGTPPHVEGWNVSFADGHCKSVSESEASQYR
jgi:prepilin-type processing-associated H-X9-DG protein